MRRAIAALAATLALAPAVALAGGAEVVSYTTGAVAQWKGTAVSTAFSLLPFLLVVSLAVEAFGRSPAQPRDFGGVVWRFLVVFVLLAGYQGIFGQLMELMAALGNSVGTEQTWDKLVASSDAFLTAKADFQKRQLAGSTGAADAALNLVAGKADVLGGVLIDVAVTLILFLGEAAHWIVAALGKVLALLLYVLGPLALAASVPRGSAVGGRWLQVFLSILTWPLISGIIAGLVAQYAFGGLAPNSSYETASRAIGFAGVLCVTAFAVPVVASALVGGGFSALGAGWAALGALGGAATGGVSAVVGGAAGLAGAGAAEGAKGAASAARAVGGGVASGLPSAAAGGEGGGAIGRRGGGRATEAAGREGTRSWSRPAPAGTGDGPGWAEVLQPHGAASPGDGPAAGGIVAGSAIDAAAPESDAPTVKPRPTRASPPAEVHPTRPVSAIAPVRRAAGSGLPTITAAPPQALPASPRPPRVANSPLHLPRVAPAVPPVSLVPPPPPADAGDA